MQLGFFFAKRYFLTRKKKKFINIISNLSTIAIALGTMTLIVALSVFNGIEDLIRSKYNQFDPSLKIVPTHGKTFELTEDSKNKLKKISGIESIVEVIEDNAYVKYNDNQVIAKIKGVSENYIHQANFRSSIIEGNPSLHKDDRHDQAIVSDWISNVLNISMANDFYTLQIWYPKHQNSISVSDRSFNKENIIVGGIITSPNEYNYIIVPLSFTQHLMEYENKRSSIEIRINNHSTINTIQRELKKILGSSFQILNQDEQHASLYKNMRIEKLFGFLTFSFILAIASLNIFFALTMLVIEKKKDIAILFTMGAKKKEIQSIFIWEGTMMSIVGACIGIVMGILVCILQQRFGFIKMGVETSDIFNNYPVKIIKNDIINTFLIVFATTFLASIKPAIEAGRIIIGKHVK